MLNADHAWRPGGAARSMDLDDLPGTSSPMHSPPASFNGSLAPGSSTAPPAGRRDAPVTQSMPAFNRDALRALALPAPPGLPRSSRRSGGGGSGALQRLGSPLIAANRIGDLSGSSRPPTAGPRARHGPVANPRAPGGHGSRLDVLLAPDVRTRLSSLAQPPRSRDGGESGSGAIKAVHAQLLADSPDAQQQDFEESYGNDDGDDVVEMGEDSVQSGDAVQRAAVEGLMAEVGPLHVLHPKHSFCDTFMKTTSSVMTSAGVRMVQKLVLCVQVRNVRYAGQPGAESDQLRLARLELKLKTLQVLSVTCVASCVTCAVNAFIAVL